MNEVPSPVQKRNRNGQETRQVVIAHFHSFFSRKRKTKKQEKVDNSEAQIFEEDDSSGVK